MDLLDQFFTHWQSIPRIGALPTLSDYFDTTNSKIQPWSIIADMDNDAMPIRLCGTAIAETMGRDFTGLDYLLAVDEKSRVHVLHRDRMCTLHPCGLSITLEANTATGRPLKHTVMALPVIRKSGAFSLIHVSAIEQPHDWRELPAAVLICRDIRWVDVGCGVPATPPWADPHYCS